jgi:tetratricopeptide (TPR) repeat protein
MLMIEPRAVSSEDRLRLAAQLFNDVWSLLEKTERTPEEDDAMLHAAHASRYHWGEVGTIVNLVRGEWQCSRVYSMLGRAEPALHHARRCLELCDRGSIGDFDLAYAYEALARAHLVAGDEVEAGRYLDRAREAGREIADDDARELLAADLSSLRR